MAPRSPQFSGRVFLLINSRTGSASEPLAYLLASRRRATLIGEKTPGAVLAAVPHKIRDGWVLVLPEADTRLADGVRLEGYGVTPDVQVPSADALLVVAESLRARAPYAAALLSAQGALQGVTRANQGVRYAQSEWWAREALRLGPDSVGSIRAVASALVAQQRWSVGFALWDSLLTANPARTAVLYQIGYFAALSGDHLDAGERALRAYLDRPIVPGLPSYAIARWRLGSILEKNGDRPAARREYEIGLALEPRNLDLAAAMQRLDSSKTQRR